MIVVLMREKEITENQKNPIESAMIFDYVQNMQHL